MAGLELSSDGRVVHAPTLAAFTRSGRSTGPLAAAWRTMHPFFPDLPGRLNSNATDGELETDYEKLLEIAELAGVRKPPQHPPPPPQPPCSLILLFF